MNTNVFHKNSCKWKILAMTAIKRLGPLKNAHIKAMGRQYIHHMYKMIVWLISPSQAMVSLSIERTFSIKQTKALHRYLRSQTFSIFKRSLHNKLTLQHLFVNKLH